MDERRREFLYELLETGAPTGFETAAQRVWIDHLSDVADDVRTDAYGNAVAVHEGDPDAPTIVVTGHGDEIGFVVRRIDDDGFLHLSRVGGTDKTVSQGQHVTVRTDDGPVAGVIGQTAIHLRDGEDDDVAEITEQYVDIGAADGEEARDLVDVGDPLTVASGVEELQSTRLTGRAMDNRVGTWSAAEALRRAVEKDVAATVKAVSTVQEEVGGNGAQMIGFDLDPDAAVVVDVTHATDTPGLAAKRDVDVALGAGPSIRRGLPDHPTLVDALRTVAADEDIAVQLEAASNTTKTDANSIFVQRGGIPSVNVGIPTRYMHTPVEVIDTGDLTSAVDVITAAVERAEEFAPFAVEP
ncbi:M20/M25/M40 family metallo-hydrolase [Halorientalis pallida]|uniref:M42 family peptidase n=1 Tax=Halorientalis pallida TaxID=2479928 RepID=A0A498KZ47_9EURY|nr:M20/M25/M40 family metallo-hydrolase [Halorientalis pallida]RXK51077.1 M42 family peptidase [Halorientalis pallida]